ncbi:hypothetical protein H2200_008236 [Cladophialophora chaetospira]|uniref:peptidylprolyl isomerase n=1 Tax=Cladophialophora chaetospira TaxID=386627 RepID=A0AA39CFX6_9EURO|nr:hypothetical protein H2200_008236 [Cladophialophora chaetospira]
MAPYKIALIPPKGDRLDLVVPFDGSKSFADLAAIAIQRATKYRSLPSSIRYDSLKLCLGADDGYLIEADDLVQDVMTTSSDLLFIIFCDAQSKNTQLHREDLSTGTGVLQIRVITPKLAQRTSEVRHIPLLQNGRYYKPSTTLKEIHREIAHHLQIPAEGEHGMGQSAAGLLGDHHHQDTNECNCKLAQLLVQKGQWEKVFCADHNVEYQPCYFGSAAASPSSLCAQCSQPLSAHARATAESAHCAAYILRRTDLPCGHVIHSRCVGAGANQEYDCPSRCYETTHTDLGSSNQLIVVFDNGKVERLELASRTHSDMMATLAERFGENFTETKTVFCKGGLEDEEGYSRLPIVAICASSRHHSNDSVSSTPHGASRIKLDLHTIEGPINTHNLSLTIKDTRLADIAINGVLTLYAVEWKPDGIATKGQGKDAMFTTAAYWRLPSVQSDRGMAAFLASLRVFSHIIGTEEFDDYRQNEVLRVVHSLTRFPPAVRAAHILMDGKTLRANESAALVQSIAVVAEELIPLNRISNDLRRSLEGARLVLGMILHSVRSAESRECDKADPADTALPYISGYHTVDLRDAKTMEPVTDPVLTNLGLVNQGTFDAFAVSALLKDSPSCYLIDCGRDDPTRIRVALLQGGVAEAPYYEAHVIGAALVHYAGVQNHSLDLEALSADISFLASLCEETKLVVVAPRQLSNAKAPSLTLDRYGNMAVYTGRAVCADPGQDHAVFHPLTGIDENVDVTIVSQMLEPILEERERDGTNVFDLFSASFRRKESLPTELIVFCVDCSYSMNEASGFVDTSDEHDDLCSDYDDDDDVLLDDEDDTNVFLEEIKTWLRDHESWEDILHIIHHYADGALDIAPKVLEFVRTSIIRELRHLAAKKRQTSRWATHAYSRTSSTERRMNRLRRLVTGLNHHEQAILDFLVFTAKDPSFVSKDFARWSYGDELPSLPPSSASQDTKDLGDFCVVPQDYLCPISQVVYEDPVKTVDGFTFDRKAIERWYRIRNSSPLTGLPVDDTTLTHQQLLSDQIRAWVKAEDVLQSLPSSPKRTRTRTRHSRAVVEFIAPSVRFSREVPGSATMLDLHKIAFRGMRGMYASFSLYNGGTHLPCTEESIGRKGMVGNQTITISPGHLPSSIGGTPKGSTVQDHMCLVRVYRHGGRTGEAFNYWVPLAFELTFSSILFHSWRQEIQEHGAVYCDYDNTPWTDLKDGGDGKAIGSRNEPWSSLSVALRNLPLVVIREEEALFGRLRDSGSQTNATRRAPEEQNPYGRCRVLKVELWSGYESAADIERKRKRRLQRLSRMAVTKQVFSQFINRLIAYNFPTSVGLVTFGTRARLDQKITDVVENFRQAVDRMKEEGDTALWDALAMAADHLVDAGRPYPEIKKRIICLSDGADTSSLRSAEDVCRTLLQHKIVVDSVCIGNSSNRALRTISYCTGGYKFVPTSVEETSALCELEPVLSIHERPPTLRPVSESGLNFILAQSSPNNKADQVTRDEYPARKTHENLNDSFVQIGRFERTRVSSSSDQQTSAVSSLRSRRLLQEVRDIANHPHPSYDVYVSESNMGFWKIVLQGPNGSAYASGTFVLYLGEFLSFIWFYMLAKHLVVSLSTLAQADDELDMGEDYPRKAPDGRFVTPMFHPNVNRHGRICHSIFDRNWTVDTTNKQVLDTIFGLLLVPEFTDPINTVVTLNYYWDEVAFKDEVVKHIQKHANHSRAQLGDSIMMTD